MRLKDAKPNDPHDSPADLAGLLPDALGGFAMPMLSPDLAPADLAPARTSQPFNGTPYGEPFKTRKGAANLIEREAAWVEDYNQGQRDYDDFKGLASADLVYLDAFLIDSGWQVYWLNVRYALTPAVGEQLELADV